MKFSLIIFAFLHAQAIMGTELRAKTALVANYGIFVISYKMDGLCKACLFAFSAPDAVGFVKLYPAAFPFGKGIGRANFRACGRIVVASAAVGSKVAAVQSSQSADFNGRHIVA